MCRPLFSRRVLLASRTSKNPMSKIPKSAANREKGKNREQYESGPYVKVPEDEK